MSQSLRTEAVEFAEEPLRDLVLDRQRSTALWQPIAERTKVLLREPDVVTGRSAFDEAERLCIGSGAVLGLVADWLWQSAVTSV